MRRNAGNIGGGHAPQPPKGEKHMEETKAGAVREAEPTETTVEQIDQEGKSTFTREEVQELLRRETDRRVTDAMRKAERKKAAAVKEAEKLAAMSADQKAQYQLEQKERELAEREERLLVAENTAEALKILADKGIRPGLVRFVVAADAETMMDNINELEKEFKASVKAEVERRMAGNTPRRNLPPDHVIDKAAFARMNLMQQQEIYQNNPELYKQLTGT
jgi:hypothetical protein